MKFHGLVSENMCGDFLLENGRLQLHLWYNSGPTRGGGQPGQYPGAQSKEGGQGKEGPRAKRGSRAKRGAQDKESIVQFYYNSKFQQSLFKASMSMILA